MKTKTFSFFILEAVLLLAIKTTSYATVNYTISFTASGVTNSVGDVQIQNLTKNTMVVVKEGNTLTLTNIATNIEAFRVSDSNIRILYNTNSGIFNLVLYSCEDGVVQVNLYNLNGQKMAEKIKQLKIGDNTFELSIPEGFYVLRVSGDSYNFSSKLLSQSYAVSNAKIEFLSNSIFEGAEALQKNKASEQTTTIMNYDTGDVLLYTAISGTYVASVTDIPTKSKTTDFVFSTIPTSAIPSGTFIMGSPILEVDRYNDETQHEVTLTPFRMSKYEITNLQYAAFLNAKSIGSDGKYLAGLYPDKSLIYDSSVSHSPDNEIYNWGLNYNGSEWIPATGYENTPVTLVTWYGASEYATYIGGTLPTEAQWEYACRAGTITPFNTGDFLTYLDANYCWPYPYNGGINTITNKSNKPQEIGMYEPNAYGLYDMHGNVSEWCADWYGAYPTIPQINPIGGDTSYHLYLDRVLRGGAYTYRARHCRSAQRDYMSPHLYYPDFGFRVVFIP